MAMFVSMSNILPCRGTLCVGINLGGVVGA